VNKKEVKASRRDKQSQKLEVKDALDGWLAKGFLFV